MSARDDLSARAIVANVSGVRLSSKISNVLAYFSRYAFVNDLAHGLP